MSGAAARTKFLMNIEKGKYVTYKKWLGVNMRPPIRKRAKRKLWMP